MLNWKDVLVFTAEPTLSDLKVPFSVVEHNVRRFNAYVDVVHIHGTLFAEVNFRFSIHGPANESVRRFYWCASPSSLLRAAYGCLDRTIEEESLPPQELLVAQGHLTYKQIMKWSEKRNLNTHPRLIPAQSLTCQPYVSIQLGVNQFDYYFVCAPEEWAEQKNWDSNEFVAIGIRTTKVSPYSDGEA